MGLKLKSIYVWIFPENVICVSKTSIVNKYKNACKINVAKIAKHIWDHPNLTCLTNIASISFGTTACVRTVAYPPIQAIRVANCCKHKMEVINTNISMPALPLIPAVDRKLLVAVLKIHICLIRGNNWNGYSLLMLSGQAWWWENVCALHNWHWRSKKVVHNAAQRP